MVDLRRETGRRGEDLAEAHLRSRDYRILARNWRTRAGELDLVAEDRAEVVFVEVRSRSGRRFGRALESVDRRKRLRLGRLAAEFLRRHRLDGRVARFDVIAVEWQNGKPVLEHVERAFDLEG